MKVVLGSTGRELIELRIGIIAIFNQFEFPILDLNFTQLHY